MFQYDITFQEDPSYPNFEPQTYAGIVSESKQAAVILCQAEQIKKGLQFIAFKVVSYE